MANFVRFAERLFYLLVAGIAITRFIPVIPHRPEVLIYLANELAGVVFILIQRKGTWAYRPYPTAIAFIGTACALAVVPRSMTLIPEWLSLALMIVGSVISLTGKLSLRRSFGLIAANRGVKTTGLYRFVRHPIYCGYMISHVGFALAFLSAWNVAVYAVAWTMFYLRAREEEKFLLQDPAYVDYVERVRFRLVPGVI